MKSISEEQKTQFPSEGSINPSNQSKFDNIREKISKFCSHMSNESEGQKSSDHINKSTEKDSQIATMNGRQENNVPNSVECLLQDKGFYLFPKLPYELRQKVWKICISQCIQCRKIIISEPPLKVEIGKPIYQDMWQSAKRLRQRTEQRRWLSIASDPLPRIILTCREVATAGNFKPMLMKNSLQRLLYSPDYDTVVLRETSYPSVTRLIDVFEQETLERIHHLEITGDLMGSLGGFWVKVNLLPLTGLKTLSMTTDGVVPPGGQAPPNVNMTFSSTLPLRKSCNKNKVPPIYTPTCTIDGQFRHGWEAINAIFERVTDPAERQRYINIWGLVNYASYHCHHLPPSISILVRYTAYTWSGQSGSDDIAVNEHRLFDYGDIIDGLVTLY
jgi:hypothetical protein